jgi:hypothetical protein
MAIAGFGFMNDFMKLNTFSSGDTGNKNVDNLLLS